MKILNGTKGPARLLPENATDSQLLVQVIKRTFLSGNDEFSYDWNSAPDEEGIWHGVLMDGRILDDIKTTPTFPVSVLVRPDGTVTLHSGKAEGLRIWENGLVTTA